MLKPHITDFTVVSADLAPELPPAKGRESPLCVALKALPRGGFIFIRDANTRTRKRVSDICSRIRRLSGGKKMFATRPILHEGMPGTGVWRTDTPPEKAPLAKRAESFEEIPWPSKDQMMRGK